MAGSSGTDNIDFSKYTTRPDLLQSALKKWGNYPSDPVSSTATATPIQTGNAPAANTAPTSTPGSQPASYPSSQPTAQPATQPQTVSQLQQTSNQNNQSWNTADPYMQQLLHGQNTRIGAMAGADYNPLPGTWDFTKLDPNKPFTSILKNYDYMDDQGQKVNYDDAVHMAVDNKPVTDVKTYDGSSFATVQDLAKSLGTDYKIDPKTGEVTMGGVKLAVNRYDKDGNPVVGVKNAAQAMGYGVNWDEKSGTVQVTKPAATPDNSPQPGQPPHPSYLDTIANSMPQMPQLSPYQSPDLSFWQNQMMPYQQFNPDRNQYFDQAHGQLDPQYQGKYNDLMAKQSKDITSMDESMNRRGIYTSGIAEAAANDLRAKTTNAVANVFMQQQSAINKMAQQLYTDSYKQYQQGNQFALKNNEFQMNQMMQQQKTSFDQWLRTQNLSMQQYHYAMDSWNKMAGYIMKDAQMQMNDQHFQQTQDWKDYSFNNLSANQQSGLTKSYDQMDQSMQKSLLPWTMGPTPYQQGQLDSKQAAQEASNYFKKLGINLDVAKLEEVIRHNQSGEDFNHQKLAADIKHWASQEQLGQDRLGLDQQKLSEKSSYDQAMIDKASNAAIDSAKRIQLQGYKSELSAVTQQINNYIANGKPAPDNLVKSYNDVMQKVEGVVSTGGGG